MIVLLCERLSQRDAEFTELDNAFTAREDRELKIELSIPTASSMETMFCSQGATLQNNFCTACADLTAVHSPAVSTTPALNTMRTDNGRFESWVAVLTSTVNDMRPQLAIAQFSISPTSCVGSATNIWVSCVS